MPLTGTLGKPPLTGSGPVISLHELPPFVVFRKLSGLKPPCATYTVFELSSSIRIRVMYRANGSGKGVGGGVGVGLPAPTVNTSSTDSQVAPALVVLYTWLSL